MFKKSSYEYFTEILNALENRNFDKLKGKCIWSTDKNEFKYKKNYTLTLNEELRKMKIKRNR
jgi:hypothetical protein